MTSSCCSTASRSSAVLCALLALIAALCWSETASAGTLDDIKARGRLVCGVSEGLRGFSQKDDTGAWQGFDVDFCKAVALAVLADSSKVDYVPLSATDRFAALTGKGIDLLSRNSTWTLSRNAQGLEFVGVSYFDGQGFLVPVLYGASSPLQLAGAMICVISETTTQDNAAAYFEKAGLKVSFLSFTNRQDARKAYAEGKCDAYTADRSALASERSLLPSPDEHNILKGVISKEPLGPVVRDEDPKWVNLVRWVLFALIDGEEMGLTSTSVTAEKAADAARLGALSGPLLGVRNDWLVRVIGGVGNYGEIFDRNLGEDTPMQLSRGINALWTQGGILYAPPIQ